MLPDAAGPWTDRTDTEIALLIRRRQTAVEGENYAAASPHAYSQANPSWCQHMLQTPSIEDRGADAGIAVTRTAFMSVWRASKITRRSTRVSSGITWSAGRHLSIVLKKVELLNCEAALPSPAALSPMNRVVLSGASSGIGLATAQAFLDDGYEVISMPAGPVRCDPNGLRSITVDLMDADATRAAAIRARQRRATTVVHCAGAIRERPIEETSIARISRRSANLRLAAHCRWSRPILPAMKQAHYGRIVLISSRAVLGLARRTAYSSTKAGMLGLARTSGAGARPRG